MTMPDAYLVALLRQHRLQADDVRLICQLADIGGLAEQVESWRFEQLFGFAVHLFITTESFHVRQQLAAILPKFGSHGVRSLTQIVHHDSLSGQVRSLAHRSLLAVEPYALAYGLTQLLAADDETFGPFILETLATLVHDCDESIFLLLSQLLPAASWQLLEQQIAQRLPAVLPFKPTSDVQAEPCRPRRQAAGKSRAKVPAAALQLV